MLPYRIEMKHLPACVHAGVGATAAVDAHVPAENPLEPPLNQVMAQIKARYDPENLFRLNQNIPPAG